MIIVIIFFILQWIFFFFANFSPNRAGLSSYHQASDQTVLQTCYFTTSNIQLTTAEPNTLKHFLTNLWTRCELQRRPPEAPCWPAAPRRCSPAPSRPPGTGIWRRTLDRRAARGDPQALWMPLWLLMQREETSFSKASKRTELKHKRWWRLTLAGWRSALTLLEAGGRGAERAHQRPRRKVHHDGTLHGVRHQGLSSLLQEGLGDARQEWAADDGVHDWLSRESGKKHSRGSFNSHLHYIAKSIGTPF